MVTYTDNDRMPCGLYKDHQLKNVPAKHLLWLLNSGVAFGSLKDYIERNKQKLIQQVHQNNKMIYR